MNQKLKQRFNHGFKVGVSKNRGTPKWMVYNGKPYFLMDDLGVPTIFGNTPGLRYRHIGHYLWTLKKNTLLFNQQKLRPARVKRRERQKWMLKKRTKTGTLRQDSERRWKKSGGSGVCYMGVSKDNGIPKSSILIGFSIINHPFWGTPIFGNTHMFMSLTNGGVFYTPCFL